MGVEVDNRQLGEGRDAHGRARVVGEDEEGGDGRTEEAVVGETVGDRGHAVLADAEADVAAGTVGGVEVPVGRDVVEGRTVEVGAAPDEERQGGSDGLEGVAARGAGGELGVGRERRDFRQQVGGDGSLGGAVEEGGLGRVGFAPGLVGLVPLVAAADEAGLVVGEVGANVVADEEMLVGGQAEPGAGGGGELGAALAVTLGGAGDLGDAAADLGLGDDELRFAALRFLRLVVGLEDGGKVVTVDRLHVPADGLEARGGVLALGAIRHGVEGDVVGVVDEDQVVELLVPGEGDRLHGDALLHAAVAGEADDVVIKDRVRRGVEARRGHLAGDSHADGVADALAQRAGGALDAGSFAELGVTRGDAVQHAELFHLVERDGVAAEVEPRVKKHAAVAGGEDEAVTVEPARALGVVDEGVAEKDGADLGGAERETEVTGGAGVDGVDGEAAGLVGGLGQEVGLQGHGNFALDLTARRTAGKQILATKKRAPEGPLRKSGERALSWPEWPPSASGRGAWS